MLLKNLKVKNKSADFDVEENESDDLATLAERFEESALSPAVREVRHSHKIDISVRSILIILLVVGGLYVGSHLFQALIVIFFAFVISSAILPLVRSIEKKGLPKWLSIFIPYLLLFVMIFATLFIVFAPFLSELSDLNSNLPNYSEIIQNSFLRITDRIGISDDGAESLVNSLGELFDTQFSLRALEDFFESDGAKATFSTLGSVSGVLGGFLLAVILSIYIVYDHDTFLDLLLSQIIDKRKRNLVKKLVGEVEYKLGAWLRGQGSVSLAVALLTWVLLVVLQIPFALPLSVLTGIMVAVPAIGSSIAFIPIIIIALITQGGLIALFVFIGYGVIQQLENSVLVPKIMGDVVGVKPIVVFVGIMIGFSLAGIVGAILTVPVLVLGKIGLDFYLSYQRLRASGRI